MIIHVGIDLGTTFSCVSYLDENGLPAMIRNSDGEDITPSVIYFDGSVAYVGKKANDRKLQANAPIYEFVKRYIGTEAANRYVINNYNYGACGLSAIILKKLKTEAFNFFKKKGLLSYEDTKQSLIIPAVITVPAYFGDKQRQETRIAGLAAGFDVTAIINEPTAAALTYGINLNEKKKILVFDLGGGTFDVTILQIGGGEANAIATDGIDQLGGKDFDEIIHGYLFSEFERQTGEELPDDMQWEVQKKALEAKIALSDHAETTIMLSAAGEIAEITLYRDAPASDAHGDDDIYLIDENEDDFNKFYFKQRCGDLLARCKSKLHGVLEKAGLTWNNIDEIVLAGGSSRMPMIPEMLESVSGQSVRRNIAGFNFDTAIAQGAALFGRMRSHVQDINSKSIGIELKRNNEIFIKHLIKKNTPLPVSISEKFKAEENATLRVYEGEDNEEPDFCTLRGKLELSNPQGEVTVGLSIDFNGTIHAQVEANGIKAGLKIKSNETDIDVEELKEKIEQVDLRL
jgi:molecular chaperone DnaK